MTLWLSDAELHEATRLRQPCAQARALDRMGVPYRRRPDGSLLVGRAALEAALARSTIPDSQPPRPANGLNF